MEMSQGTKRKGTKKKNKLERERNRKVMESVEVKNERTRNQKEWERKGKEGQV